MARGLAGVLVVFCALVAPASAADTVIGSGLTAWGTTFTLYVSQEKGPRAPQRCLNYADAGGAGGGCPLERPAVDELDVQSTVACERKHVALYGALDARVARVVVRLVGGQTLTAQRFDPAPAIDPQMAYWIVTFKGGEPVRSITAIAADGSVLARDRHPERPCEEERNEHARRYPIAVLTEPGGPAWRLSGYRALVDDEEADGHHLVRTHCFELRQVPADSQNDATSGTCGVGIERGTKALAVIGDGLGCRAGGSLILYGFARAKVARIVIRSRAGWTVAVPSAGPPKLRAPAPVWWALVPWPRSGIVIDAQDLAGHTIAKERIKPTFVPGIDACAGSFFGSL